MTEQQDRIFSPAYETRIPIYIIYEDGWEQQTDISRAELFAIIGSQRRVGSTIRIVKEVLDQQHGQQAIAV